MKYSFLLIIQNWIIIVSEKVKLKIMIIDLNLIIDQRSWLNISADWDYFDNCHIIVLLSLVNMIVMWTEDWQRLLFVTEIKIKELKIKNCCSDFDLLIDYTVHCWWVNLHEISHEWILSLDFKIFEWYYKLE